MPLTESQLTDVNEIVWLKGQYDKAVANDDEAGKNWAAKTAQEYYAKLPNDIADYLEGVGYEDSNKYLIGITTPAIIVGEEGIAGTINVGISSSGNDVREMQTLLTDAGFNPGKIDGIFGENTRLALIDYQTSRSLSPDGICGSITWNALRTGKLPYVIVGEIPIEKALKPLVFKELSYGNAGDDVKYLQLRLLEYGFSPGLIDGFFGEKTKVAVILYQTSRGLVQDGIVGNATWSGIEQKAITIEVPELWGMETDYSTLGSFIDWKYIIVHNTGAEEVDANQVKQYHLSQGYVDVGYNFIIERDGKIIIGRDLNIPGAHTDSDGMNKKGIGIAVIGNMQNHACTPEQWKSLLTLVKYLANEFNIPYTNVLGHNEVLGSYTYCPGKYIDMNELRSALPSITEEESKLNLLEQETQFRSETISSIDMAGGIKDIVNLVDAAATSFIKYI